MRTIKNVDAANCLVENALAYLRDKELSEKQRLEIVEANLETIEKLLENPDWICTEYSWDDFK